VSGMNDPFTCLTTPMQGWGVRGFVRRAFAVRLSEGVAAPK